MEEQRKLTVVTFHDYGTTMTKVLSSTDKTDVTKALSRAAKVAEKDGLRFQLSAIPEKYLNQHGLKSVSIENIDMDNHGYGQTAAEKNGVYNASCRDCNSFEDGSCYRYGGLCNPDSVLDDCIHGDNIILLIYDDGNTKSTFPLSLDDSVMDRLPASDTASDVTDETVLWLVEQLKTDDNEYKDDMTEITKREDYRQEFWRIQKTR